MLNKKYLFLFSLILVSLCAVSCASASEDVNDTLTVDDADIGPVETSIDENLETNEG